MRSLTNPVSDFIHENLFYKILDISFNSRYTNKKLVNKGMQQVKEIFDNDLFAIDGMNFTEFKAYCKNVGIRGVTVEKILDMFTPSEHDGIYNYETEEVLVQLSDPSTFECNRFRKSKQYYFQVIG